MTDHADDPLFDALRAANPVPTPPLPSADADQLLQEILMSDPTSPSQRDFGPAPTKDELTPRRNRTRRFALTGAAAATAAVVGFGAVALAPGSSTPAQAAMVSAAEDTEAVRSGTAIVTVDTSVDERLDDLVLVTAFDGSDLSATLETGSLGVDFGGDPEVRLVDGVIYLSIVDGQWFSVEDPRITDLVAASGLPVDIRNDLSRAIVELVESASDVEELESGHFTATVSVDEIRRIAENYPTLGLYSDSVLNDNVLNDSVLNEKELDADVGEHRVAIDLVLDDAGLIDVVTIGTSAVDPDTDEAIDGSIRIDLNDLGTPQTIDAPADATPMDLAALLGSD